MQEVKIKLKIPCPPSCVCGSKQVKNWTNKGEISCEKGCPPIFCQNYGFKCKLSKTNETFKSATQFIMALGISMQTVEGLSSQELMNFLMNLNTNVLTRWAN